MAQVEWLSREDAAKRLNLSERRVAELAKEGRLKRRFARGTRGARVIEVDAGSVERFATDVQAGIRPERSAPMRALARIKGDGGESLVRLARAIAPKAPRAPLAPGGSALFMTIDETAEYSGIPRSVLTQWIKAGRLQALDVGPRPGGRWRVRREAVNALDVSGGAATVQPIP
jgi:excisionase family DNA binding protein